MGMGVPHGTPGEGVSAAIAHSLDPTPGSFACSHSCSHRALGIEKRLEAPPGFEPGVEVLQAQIASPNTPQIANSLTFLRARLRLDPPEDALDG